VFWSNTARLTWSLEGKDDYAILTMQKHNNHAMVAKQKIEMHWQDGKLQALTETGYQEALIEIIRGIRPVGQTAAQIRDEVNAHIDDERKQHSPDYIGKAIRRDYEKHPADWTKTGTDRNVRWTYVTGDTTND
jgi:hypothetical protein